MLHAGRKFKMVDKFGFAPRRSHGWVDVLYLFQLKKKYEIRYDSIGGI